MTLPQTIIEARRQNVVKFDLDIIKELAEAVKQNGGLKELTDLCKELPLDRVAFSGNKE